jgi:enoyl-CoA hydratase
MAEDAEILFEVRGRAGIITLNRPKALNALTLGMVRQLHPRLVAWANDAAIDRVVIRAAGEKAFCAGGDIRQLHDWGRARDGRALDFYREEYRLNAYIKRYPKPYVALIDGIVMGGGVGVSVHGSHRIAGSRTVFAMPETGIGLFPDVGGTWFLPRLPGSLGTYLALTGARLGRSEAVWSGIATAAAGSDAFADILAALCGPGDTDALLAPFAAPAEAAPVRALMPVIDRCFSADSVEEVLERLDRERGDHAEWAQKTIATMRSKSPVSQKIALRQMRLGAQSSFEDCMRIEYRIVSRVLAGHEFFEGVRALIIDKDNQPRWRPDRLEDVSDADVDAYFAPLDEELDLGRLDTLGTTG